MNQADAEASTIEFQPGKPDLMSDVSSLEEFSGPEDGECESDKAENSPAALKAGHVSSPPPPPASKSPVPPVQDSSHPIDDDLEKISDEEVVPSPPSVPDLSSVVEPISPENNLDSVASSPKIEGESFFFFLHFQSLSIF